MRFNTTPLHMLAVGSLIAHASAACAPAATIERELAAHSFSREQLSDLLRGCATQAELSQTLLVAVRAVLSSRGEPAGLVAAARAMLESLDSLSSTDPPSQQRSAMENAPPAAASDDDSRGIGGASSTTSARRELSTWHESVEDQLQAQRAQARVVSERIWPSGGKPQTIVHVAPALPSGTTQRYDIRCDKQLYELGLAPVAHCTPAVSATSSSHGDVVPGVPCARHVRDHFLSTSEQIAMVAVLERAMKGLFHQGAATAFAPEAASSIKHMGADGARLFANVSRRVRQAL